MMNTRYESIGIKQVIRLEWMRKTSQLLLSGMAAQVIRQELHQFLLQEQETGTDEAQSSLTRTFAVNNLMKIWVSPDPELISYRDASLALLRERPSMDLPIHWGMISSAYPFWFNVAKQTGRLLTLQDQVTQAQIIKRLKEQYGDRQTVSRYARFVIRAFVAWGVLLDADDKGCYRKADVGVLDSLSVMHLLESVLLSMPEEKAPLGILLSSPSLYPFRLPGLTGDFIAQQNPRIKVMRYGLDDELLSLRGRS